MRPRTGFARRLCTCGELPAAARRRPARPARRACARARSARVARRRTGSPAAAQTRSWSSRARRRGRRECRPGGTPPIAKPVAARTSSASPGDLGHVERVGDLLGVHAVLSGRHADDRVAVGDEDDRLGDLASSQPTAVAASATVARGGSRRCTCTSIPRSRAHSASLSLRTQPLWQGLVSAVSSTGLRGHRQATRARRRSRRGPAIRSKSPTRPKLMRPA